MFFWFFGVLKQVVGWWHVHVACQEDASQELRVPAEKRAPRARGHPSFAWRFMVRIYTE